MWILAALTLLIVTYDSSIESDMNQAQSIRLRVQNETLLSGEKGGIVMVPLKCDERGSVYVRGYRSDDPVGVPVVKFSAEGRRVTTFDVRAIPVLKESGVAADFAVGLRGEVFMLVLKSPEERVIVKFRSDGRFDTQFELSPFFDPSTIAVLSSGEMLVSGLKYSRERSEAVQPITALYDRSGKLIKVLELRDDVQFEDKQRERPESDSPKPDATPDVSEIERYASVSLGAAEAEGRNFYLMRAESNPIVFVISESGDVVHRFVAASPGPGFRPVTMKVAGGRVAIQFEETAADDKQNRGVSKQVFAIFDSSSGEKLLEYTTPAEVGGAFACYSPDAFIFLSTGHNLALKFQKLAP